MEDRLECLAEERSRMGKMKNRNKKEALCRRRPIIRFSVMHMFLRFYMTEVYEMIVGGVAGFGSVIGCVSREAFGDNCLARLTAHRRYSFS